MSIYYLFSDFNMEKGFTKEVANNLYKDIKDDKTIAFIASDPDYGSGTDKYAIKYLEWFSEIGINFKKYRVIDNRMAEDEMKETIRNASAVFLMGGMTPVQFKFLKANELDKVLKEYKGCVLGLSAGAINMAKVSICSKGSGHDKTDIYEGLNLVDISVEPHFIYKSSKSISYELLSISERYDIYAMCDESSIICREGNRYFYGEIYLISNGEISQMETI